MKAKFGIIEFNALILLGIVFSLNIFSTIGQGAIKPEATTADSILKTKTISLRLEGLKRLGPQAYRQISDLAFDTNKDMRTRWKAAMAMFMMGDENSWPEVKRSLEDSDW